MMFTSIPERHPYGIVSLNYNTHYRPVRSFKISKPPASNFTLMEISLDGKQNLV